MENKWVQIWGQAHSNLSHFYYPSCEKTFRFIISSAISGKAVRIELSNEFARNDVTIGEITVAKCNKNGDLLSEPVIMTSGKKGGFIIEKGAFVYTDEVPLSIDPSEYLAVSIFVKDGDLRSGNLLNNVTLLTVKGNETHTVSIVNQKRKRDSVIKAAGNILNLALHKPLPLIQSVQVLNDTDASSIIVLGDSLSQQGFWTNRLEERIRAEFPGKYTLINRSIMGNRVLRDYSPRFPCKGLFGYAGTKRFLRDVLSYPDCSYCILALGTNDFLQYGTIAAKSDEKPTADAVFDGIKHIYDKLSENGIKTIVVNTVKFGECIDSRKEKELMVQAYNEKLQQNSRLFYYVFDQASLVENKNKPYCTSKEYLGKDYLHFNELGGKKVADNFPVSLFCDRLNTDN